MLKRAQMSDKQFNDLRKFIYNRCGINLGSAKRTMLEGRLQKRLAYLEMESFDRYCQYLFSEQGLHNELTEMLDVVTTNKTDFFREPGHFHYLSDELLPSYLESDRKRNLKVWSAACSTGQEPYTIAMVLEEAAERMSFEYKITATDISSRVLARGRSATYHASEAEAIPSPMRKKYLLKSKDPSLAAIRVVPGLRRKVEFKHVNLIESIMPVDNDFDVVFCRNVLIYFDKTTQEQVVSNIIGRLKVGGYLFIGHSESIYQMDVPLRQIRPTIYERI